MRMHELRSRTWFLACSCVWLAMPGCSRTPDDRVALHPASEMLASLPEWRGIAGGYELYSLALRDDAQEGWALTGFGARHYRQGEFITDSSTRLLDSLNVLEIAVSPDGKTGWALGADRQGKNVLSASTADRRWRPLDPGHPQLQTDWRGPATLWYDHARRAFFVQFLRSVHDPETKPDPRLWTFRGGRWAVDSVPGEVEGGIRFGPAPRELWTLDAAGVLTGRGQDSVQTRLDSVVDVSVSTTGAVVALRSDGGLVRFRAGQWAREPCPVIDFPDVPPGRSAGVHLWMSSDGGRGLVYGDGGILARYENGGWTIPPGSTGISDFAAQWFDPHGRGLWLLGARGTVAYRTRGRWERSSIPLDSAVTWTSLAFGADGQRGFAVGTGGAIARYSDGRWTRVQSPTSADLVSVWVDAAGTRGFAATAASEVLRLRDTTWAALRLPARVSRSRTVEEVFCSEREELCWLQMDGTLLQFELDAASLAGATRAFDRANVRYHWTGSDGTTWVENVLASDRSELWKREGGRWTPFRFGRAPLSGPFWVSRDSLRSLMVGPPTEEASDIPCCSLLFRLSKDFYQQPFEPRLDPFAGARRSDEKPGVPAIWLNDEGTAGWVVGDHGFVGEYAPYRPVFPEIEVRSGSLEHLSGTYEIRVPAERELMLAGVALRLDGRSVLPLTQSEDYTLTQRSQSEYRLTFLSPAHAFAEDYRHHKVSLRVDVFDMRSTPYYQFTLLSDPVRLEGRDPAWYAVWIVAGALLLNAVLVLCAIRIEPIRLIVFHPVGSRMVGLVVGKYLVIEMLARFVRPIRLALFSTYRSRLRTSHPAFDPAEAAGYIPPDVDIPREALFSTDVGEPAWKTAYRRMRASAGGVVWFLEGRSGLGKTVLFERWAEFALELGDTPFLVRMGSTDSIDKEIRTAMVQFGGFPRKAPPLFDHGGFVFLLDGLNEAVNVGEAREFVRLHSARSLVIISSQFDPHWGSDVRIESVLLHEFGQAQLAAVLPRAVVNAVLSNEMLLGWARLPQNAKLLARYYERTGELPRTQSALYDELRADLHDEPLATALEGIAWDLFRKREVLIKPSAAIPQEWLDSAVEGGVLTPRTEPEGRFFRFAHDKIRHYFVARYLFSRHSTDLKSLHAEVSAGVGKEYWAETLEFWAELCALAEYHGETGAPRHISFLKQVFAFHPPTFRRLYVQASQLRNAEIIGDDASFDRWAAEAMARQ